MELRILAGRAAWLGRLPDVLRNLEHRWADLNTPLDDEEVSCSYVTAAVRAEETPAVLKIEMPHMEEEHEIQGLHFWDGDPTVRLLMAERVGTAKTFIGVTDGWFAAPKKTSSASEEHVIRASAQPRKDSCLSN